MDIRLGCCGFARGMKNYFKKFEMVEVQQTFYQPPKIETALKWRKDAPDDFEFTLKAWQLITHTPRSPTYRRAKIEIDKGWQRAKIDLQPQEGGTNIGLNFELSDASITLPLLSMGYVLLSIISSMVTRHSAGMSIGIILLITFSMAEIYWYDRRKEKRKKFAEEMIRSIDRS